MTDGLRRLGLGLLLALLLGGNARAGEWRLGLLSLADAGPDRTPALRLALDESGEALRAAGTPGWQVLHRAAPSAAALPVALDALVQQGVQQVVLDLPAEQVAALAAQTRHPALLLVNAGAPEDGLRARQCDSPLLHTLPSQAMAADALAQFLVARRWTRVLVLHGPRPQDALLLQAYRRSARLFGLQTVAERPFKRSSDPRERALGSALLLTSGVEHDVVLVLDSDGAFARGLPYATRLPRPVVGSAGLTVQAWQAGLAPDGAQALNRRFVRSAQRAMDSVDWAVWVAGKALVQARQRWPQAQPVELARHLRQDLALDGAKGQRLGFRAWDGQLRQPLLLVQGDAVVAQAPLDGFLHPRSTLDTLGLDAAESGCAP